MSFEWGTLLFQIFWAVIVFCFFFIVIVAGLRFLSALSNKEVRVNYSKPRTSTQIASSDGYVWILESEKQLLSVYQLNQETKEIELVTSRELT